MKKSLQFSKAIVLLSVLATLMQGCLKDTGTKTYTLFLPVYKTVAEVRAGMKSEGAVAVNVKSDLFTLFLFGEMFENSYKA